jgi:hypothetical protein
VLVFWQQFYCAAAQVPADGRWLEEKSQQQQFIESKSNIRQHHRGAAVERGLPVVNPGKVQPVPHFVR